MCVPRWLCLVVADVVSCGCVCVAVEVRGAIKKIPELKKFWEDTKQVHGPDGVFNLAWIAQECEWK